MKTRSKTRANPDEIQHLCLDTKGQPTAVVTKKSLDSEKSVSELQPAEKKTQKLKTIEIGDHTDIDSLFDTLGMEPNQSLFIS